LDEEKDSGKKKKNINLRAYNDNAYATTQSTSIEGDEFVVPFAPVVISRHMGRQGPFKLLTSDHHVRVCIK